MMLERGAAIELVTLDKLTLGLLVGDHIQLFSLFRPQLLARVLTRNQHSIFLWRADTQAQHKKAAKCFHVDDLDMENYLLCKLKYTAQLKYVIK